MFLINLLLSSLQQINSTFVDNISSTWLPTLSTAKPKFQNINAAQDRGKRETDTKPSHIAVLYPVDSKSREGTQRSNKYKRCQGKIRKGKVHYNSFQKGIASSNYTKKDDDVNYYKSTYPSLTADNENGRSTEFRVDNDGVPKVKPTAVTQAMDNGCEASTPQSFAGYIQQASNSDEGRGEWTRLQQLLAVGNGYRAGSNSLKKEQKINGREPKFNKHKSWKPSDYKNGHVNTEHQNEGSTKTNTQTYSRFLSDSSTDPSLQNDLETPGTRTEYHYPHDDIKSMLQNVNRRRNPPLKEKAYLKSTLPAKDLFKDNYFPQSTTYRGHQHDNAQILDSELYDNRYENNYWEPEIENEYQDAPTNPELKHNMMPITDSEPFIRGHNSEDTLNKVTGINEDIRHNMVVNDMPLYPSSDERRLMQGHMLSQNGINNSPYIRRPPSNMERYLPGKSSGVLQEDEVLVHSIPGANETSIHYSEIPDVSSKKLKFSSSRDGMWRKDSRLTTENSILPLPTASHNIMPSNSYKHTPKFYSDFDEMLNNRVSPKFNNDIVSTHQDVPVTSHYISHKNKIPSGELSCFTEVNKPKEDLQFTYKNEERTSPHNYKVPPLTNVQTWAGPMTDHSKYTHRVDSTSPYRDDPEGYFSSNGRNPAFKSIHFPTSTYQVIEQNEDLPPHKSVPTSQYYHEMSTPSHNINIENSAFQSKTEPQLLYKRPTNKRLKEGTNNMKVSVPEEEPYDESTFISQISDISKYLPSASVPSLNKARTEILQLPDGTRSVTSSANDDGRFNLQTDSQKFEPSFEVGMVSDRTKSEFSRMFQNTINDLHSVPISSITSLKHAHLTPIQTSSINMETRSKSEDTLRPADTLVPQYPAEIKETLAGIYSAATNSPLLTTVTLGTYHPGSSEAYPQMAVLNEYKSETNMGVDVIPTLHSNVGYKNTLYSVTETVTAEPNNDNISNSDTELPYEFKKQSWNKTSDFPESIQSDTNSGKDMFEKWTIESEQSTSVMPNLYKMNKLQDVALSTTDTSDDNANTGDMTEETNWNTTGLSIEELKNQVDLVPMNTKYETTVRDEVTQGQDTNYPVTTITDLQSEPRYIPVSDVADIYMTTDKLDAHTAMTSTAASDVYKNTYPGELSVPDKKPSSENDGNYYFPTATVSLPETMTNTIYINAEPHEMLTPIQEQILHQLYSTTIMPPEIEVHKTTKKTELKLIQVPETVINYKGKVVTHTAGDETIAPRDSGLEREQQILGKGADYESDKPIPAHEFSENHEEQTHTQMDTENIFKTKENERNDLKIIQVPETAINYREDVPTQTAGYELVTPRDKGHEREQLILGKEADYESDKPITAHKFSENYKEQTNTQKDTENMFQTKTNDKTDLNIIEVPEPGINYKKVPIYKMENELVTPSGKGHEWEQLILDEGDIYESDKQITAHQFPDNHKKQTDTQTDVENTFKTKTNGKINSKMIQVPELALNYKVKVPTYIMRDELVTSARGKGHEREQLILDEGDVYKSDKQMTTHQFSDNHEEQINTHEDLQNTFMTKAIENYRSPGILKAETSREEQETSYLNAVLNSDITNTYKITLPEATTFQTVATPIEIMTGITATSIPTERSDTPQSMYFTIQDEDGRTGNLDKYNNNNSLVQKDDPQYLHTDEYDTSQSNHLTTTAQEKHYNNEHMRSPSNMESGLEDTALDVWKQNEAHKDEKEEKGLDALSFIVPTLAPQQNEVTSNYIQLHETQLGESTQPPPEIQNKQNNVISDEQSMNGYTSPSKVIVHADIPALQHLSLGLQNSENLPTKNILLGKIGDMTKSLQDIVNSTKIINKPYQDQELISDHNTLQLSDSLQPAVYTRNGLTQMHSDDAINSNINKIGYTDVRELQTDVTSEYPPITYIDLNRRLYKETPEAAGLSFKGIKSFAGNANMGHDMDHQRHTSDGYTPQVELDEDLSVIKHDYFDSHDIQLPKETQESKNKDDRMLESSISGTNKQNGTENIIQAAHSYPNFEGHDIKFANEDDNDKQDIKFETKDANHVLYGHEILSPNYNRQLVPERNTDSSTLQIQSQSKNAERYHSSLQQTAEPKHTYKNQNEAFETITQYTSTDPLTEIHRDTKEQECYMHCNNILISRSKDREDYMKKEGTRKSILFPPDDVTGILPEYIQSRNGIAGSIELVGPDDLGEILRDHKKPEYVSRIVTNNEKPEGVTEAAKENKLDEMRVTTENRQAGGVRTEYKQMEEDLEDIIDYKRPEEITVQDYKQPDDPTTVQRDHKQPEYELQVEYTTEDHKVLQSGVVTEQMMTLQGGSKRTRNTQNLYTTNAITESGEDTRNIMNTYKKTLTFLLQNKEKIQLLLDLPYSYKMTSTPATSIRREIRSQLNREPTEDQGQVEAMNLVLKKIKPANVDYRSIETTDINQEQPKHVIMDSNKSNELSPSESLGGKNRQATSLKDMHTVKSDSCKTIDTFNDEYNLRHRETLQQPCISRKEYSCPTFMVPSVNVDRSEVLHKRNKKPKQKLELKPVVRDSDDTWGTAVNLAHLPSQNSMRTECSNCGPWALYKNYFSIPPASPRLDHHLLLPDDESINTVPTSSYETNISSDPEYGYEMDSNLESDEMEQASSLNFHNQQQSRYNNVQRSDTLNEKEMVLKENIIDYDVEENQNLPDDSKIDAYNAFDSPQLFKFYMYNDEKSSQPKLYNKRKSNSNHNIGYIPEESYQKLIKDSVVSRRPVSMGNWKKYKGSPEGIMHPKPCAFKKRNYKTHRQHSSNVNTNEDNIKSFPLGFKERKINKGYNDDNGEIRHYRSGERKYEQPTEWEFSNIDNSRSSLFGEAYDQSKEHSGHEDCSEETITQASPEISLKNANKLFDGNIIRMSVNDPSYDTEVLNKYNNNYKKILPSEKTQKISKNNYKYSNDYKYPIKYHELSVKDNGQRDNDIHQTITQHLLHQNNNHIFHQPQDNDNSWGDAHQTNESDENNVIRRTRNAIQYTTIGSSEEKKKDSYPQYQSRSCQSYNCEGVLASEVKIVTAILKWLKNMVTDIKKT